MKSFWEVLAAATIVLSNEMKQVRMEAVLFYFIFGERERETMNQVPTTRGDVTCLETREKDYNIAACALVGRFLCLPDILLEERP